MLTSQGAVWARAVVVLPPALEFVDRGSFMNDRVVAACRASGVPEVGGDAGLSLEAVSAEVARALGLPRLRHDRR